MLIIPTAQQMRASRKLISVAPQILENTTNILELTDAQVDALRDLGYEVNAQR